MEILLIEHNHTTKEYIINGLEEESFSITTAIDTTEAKNYLDEKTWDIIILDIEFPDIDGLGVIQYIRYKEIWSPVLAIGTFHTPDDIVEALENGADDCLNFPFYFKEFVARIRVLTRRKAIDTQKSDILQSGNLKLFSKEYRVMRGDEDIRLTMQEFKLLKLLMENKNRVLSRATILDKVWGIHYDTNTNVVDVYISYLRNKIEKKG